MAKKKFRDYSMIKADDIPQKVEPERVRIISSIAIDRNVFQKDSQEKKTLKWLKSQLKNDK